MEILYIPDFDDGLPFSTRKAKNCLCYYKLAWFTVSMGNHFYLITRLNDVWYKYNDMLKPKLTEWEKNTTLWKVNTVFCILNPDLCIH